MNSNFRKYIWNIRFLGFIVICAFLVGTVVSYYIITKKNGDDPSGKSLKVEVIPSPRTIVGTRAHWDELAQSLYYNDVEGVIYRYDYKADKVYSATVDREPVIAFIIPVASNATQPTEFALGLGRRVAIAKWDGISSKAVVKSIVFEVESDKSNNRFNAAKADPFGRLYVGTMWTPENCGNLAQTNAVGALYKYEKGNGVQKLVNHVYISNGLTWNEAERKLFYVDSCRFDIKEYVWYPQTGNISYERVVRNFGVDDKHPGFLPDGLTIDTAGNLYLTTFSGSNVLKIDPKSGEILLDIQFPCKQITSVAFGGSNLDILFVTTASIDDLDNELAGQLFKITGLDSKGFPGVRVRI